MNHLRGHRFQVAISLWLRNMLSLHLDDRALVMCGPYLDRHFAAGSGRADLVDERHEDLCSAVPFLYPDVIRPGKADYQLPLGCPGAVLGLNRHYRLPG